jgi:putative endonuclease
MPYYVYMVKCADGTLYTGSTNSLEKRILAHNTLPTGAKYTSRRRPVELAYSEEFQTRSEAMKREYVIKQMQRREKIELIEKRLNP